MNESTTAEQIKDLKDRYCELYEAVHGLKASWVYGQLISVAELEYMVDQYTFFRHEEARRNREEEIRRKATAS